MMGQYIIASSKPWNKNTAVNLQAATGEKVVNDWAFQKLITMGKGCRAMLCETLMYTLTWVISLATGFSWFRGRVIQKRSLT